MKSSKLIISQNLEIKNKKKLTYPETIWFRNMFNKKCTFFFYKLPRQSHAAIRIYEVLIEDSEVATIC